MPDGVNVGPSEITPLALNPIGSQRTNELTMATHPNRSLITQIRDRNHRLDDQLRKQVGICVETYKRIVLALRVIGIALIVGPYYFPGVEPLSQTATLVVAAFVLGPDVVEAYLTREG